MAITIKEISELCGVSPGTVDRALNGRPGISSKTKAKILKVAKEYNYRPDHRARSLARGRTMTLGVVLFDLHNRSFSQLLNAIENRSRELGYFVDLALTDKDPENEIRLIDRLVQRKVDGLILFTVNIGDAFNKYLHSLKIPIVTICNWVSDQWTYIGINDRQAMRDAARHIAAKGYERIVYISPPLSFLGKTNIFTQEERLHGLLAGCKETDFPSEPTIIQQKNYLDALQHIELLHGPKTAIVCSCDYYALEVMNNLKKRNIRIPQDVGLMGFDNIDVLKYVSPALTTVEYVVEEMGERAVDSLVLHLEEGVSKKSPLLSYRIIEGDSL